MKVVLDYVLTGAVLGAVACGVLAMAGLPVHLGAVACFGVVGVVVFLKAIAEPAGFPTGRLMSLRSAVATISDAVLV